jgi:hypothetical protein
VKPLRRKLVVVAGVAVLTLAVCGCSSSHSSHPASSSTTSRRALAARYLVVAEAGNRALEHDFDGLEDRDGNDLHAARGDLLDAAATERRFDRRLLALALPPAMETTARTLVRVNEARAALTTLAASAGSVAELHSFLTRLTAANTPVEDQVKALRRQLGLPPPETS